MYVNRAKQQQKSTIHEPHPALSQRAKNIFTKFLRSKRSMQVSVLWQLIVYVSLVTLDMGRIDAVIVSQDKCVII